MNGTIQSIQERTGAYGKFSSVMVNGEEISAFNSHHEVARSLAAGDPVEYTYEIKGKYKQFSSLKRGAAAVSAAGMQGGTPKVREFITRDESVLVSYAKDLIAAQPDFTPELAVNTVMDIVQRVKAKVAENPQT